MNDFEWDCYQKKKLAQQAKYRKRGSHSRKCILSTDTMSQRQINERNGKTVSVNFNEPIEWGVFKSLSKQTQADYLESLRDTYGANLTSLSSMFGVSVSTIRRHIESTGIGISFPVGHSMSNDQKDAWQVFLSSSSCSVNKSNEEAEICDDKINEEDDMPTKMYMDGFSLSFDGRIYVDSIVNSCGTCWGITQ